MAARAGQAADRGRRGARLRAALGLALLCGLLCGGAPKTARAQAEITEAPDPDSPRRALERFLAHTQHGRFSEAALDLELPAEPDEATLAGRLAARGISGLCYYNPALHLASRALPNYIRDLLA